LKTENVIIIAEAGVNHNGNLDLAKELAAKAKETGADYVKYQSFITELNILKDAPKAKYQLETTNLEQSQFEMLKGLELSLDQTKELKEYCDNIDIRFLTTPADKENMDLVKTMELDYIKVASESIVNYPLLQEIGKMKGRVVLSTGMSTLNEIDSALNVLVESGTRKDDIILLHCNSQYPTPFEDINLKAMITLSNKFGLPVGLSDHSLGIEVSIAATAMGACIIEKHFTLDNTMDGPDHRCSLNPFDFSKMVLMIRNIESSLGSGQKEPSPSEKINISYMRRSIMAKENIKAGEILTEENLIVKRPGTGLSPMLWPTLIGKRAVKDFNKDDFITLK